jgi:hydrogenase nickel incorporation protein HypA/HybF
VHELSLLRPVVLSVARAADKAGADRVATVGLRVGTMSGAMPEALEGAWPIATADVPALRDARLIVEVIPAAIWCPGCQGEVEIDEFYALTCPVCGPPCGNLVHGREFEIAYAERPDSAEEWDAGRTANA